MDYYSDVIEFVSIEAEDLKKYLLILHTGWKMVCIKKKRTKGGIFLVKFRLIIDFKKTELATVNLIIYEF